MDTFDTGTKSPSRRSPREYVASYRNGRKRVDFYIVPSVIPELAYFQAKKPDYTVSDIINAAIRYAYQGISGKNKAPK